MAKNQKKGTHCLVQSLICLMSSVSRSCIILLVYVTFNAASSIVPCMSLAHNSGYIASLSFRKLNGKNVLIYLTLSKNMTKMEVLLQKTLDNTDTLMTKR
jgi:hypothetical protein